MGGEKSGVKSEAAGETKGEAAGSSGSGLSGSGRVSNERVSNERVSNEHVSNELCGKERGGNGRAGVTRDSTYEEVWEYMQSFRPTKDEVRRWIDGTHTERYPPDGRREWRVTYTWGRIRQTESGLHYERHRDGGKPSYVYVKNPDWLNDHARWDREEDAGEESFGNNGRGGETGDGRSDGGKKGREEGGGSDLPLVEYVRFYEAGLPRSGELPWLLEFSPEGEVVEAQFSTGGKEGHRMGGPETIQIQVEGDKALVQLRYVIHGETIEVVRIWQKARPS